MKKEAPERREQLNNQPGGHNEREPTGFPRGSGGAKYIGKTGQKETEKAEEQRKNRDAKT